MYLSPSLIRGNRFNFRQRSHLCLPASVNILRFFPQTQYVDYSTKKTVFFPGKKYFPACPHLLLHFTVANRILRGIANVEFGQKGGGGPKNKPPFPRCLVLISTFCTLVYGIPPLAFLFFLFGCWRFPFLAGFGITSSVINPLFVGPVLVFALFFFGAVELKMP